MLWKTWKPGISEETSVGSPVRAFHTFFLHPVLQSHFDANFAGQDQIVSPEPFAIYYSVEQSYETNTYFYFFSQ